MKNLKELTGEARALAPNAIYVIDLIHGTFECHNDGRMLNSHIRKLAEKAGAKGTQYSFAIVRSDGELVGANYHCDPKFSPFAK